MIEVVIKCDRCGKSDRIDVAARRPRISLDGKVAWDDVSIIESVMSYLRHNKSYSRHKAFDNDYFLCRECQEAYEAELRDIKKVIDDAQAELWQKRSRFFASLGKDDA